MDLNLALVTIISLMNASKSFWIESHRLTNTVIRLNKNAICLFMIASMAFSQASYAGEKMLQMKSSAEIDSEGKVLTVRLFPAIDTPKNVYKSALPWGLRQSITIIPVLFNKREQVLEEFLYADDPQPGVDTVKPGDIISGTINLDSRFLQLSSSLAKGDVVLFWTFQIETIAGELFERQTGCLVVNKKKK